MANNSCKHTMCAPRRAASAIRSTAAARLVSLLGEQRICMRATFTVGCGSSDICDLVDARGVICASGGNGYGFVPAMTIFCWFRFVVWTLWSARRPDERLAGWDIRAFAECVTRLRYRT